MIQGTSSSVGKSILVTALCRIFAQDGLKVAPFKAQNMALNSFVTEQGGEMGRSQVVQAQAAGIEPAVEMNPILLKPEADSCSQVVVMGRPWKTLSAGEYYRFKKKLWHTAAGALDSLCKDHELIIIEGAGSPAEINLKRDEIVNMRVARYLNAPVLLAGDIDRGGVFASLVGTLSLLDPEERELIKGFIINKFRGDIKLLEPGLEMLRRLTENRPTLGVIPYIKDLRIAQEDSVFLDSTRSIGSGGMVNIGVVRFPHISNYNDMDALVMEENVRVYFVESVEELGQPDAVILPGTKTTLEDLRWLRTRGLDGAITALVASGISLAGICGGYQMLGAKVRDRFGVEGRASEQPGLGLLPVETDFEPRKTTVLTRARILGGEGFLRGLEDAEVEGYEIHMGACMLMDGAASLLRFENGRLDGSVSVGGRVWGTYLHGIFDTPAFRRGWLRSLGWQGKGSGEKLLDFQECEINRLADHVRSNIDMPLLHGIIAL
jgi:adenosylcobyric acid synthase